MKRHKSKLTLDRQSIRILSTAEITTAAGGFSVPLSGCDSCSGCCKPPE